VSKRPQPLAAREIGVVLGSHAHKELQADLTGPIDRDGLRHQRRPRRHGRGRHVARV
jgi:hypothetical protein